MPTLMAPVVAYGPAPTALMATIRNVYVVPSTRPVTVCEFAVELNVCGACATVPTIGVITKPVTGEPFAVAACHETMALPPVLAGLTAGNPTEVGVPTVIGSVVVPTMPVPTAFTATILNV